MNKAELIDAIAAATGGSKVMAKEHLEATIQAIHNSLSKGDPVALVGFGTFGVKSRAQRQGRNPQTGESIVIHAKTVPYFTPGKSLKDAAA